MIKKKNANNESCSQDGLIGIIKNSLKKGLSPELISEVTGVAIKEIEKLKTKK